MGAGYHIGWGASYYLLTLGFVDGGGIGINQYKVTRFYSKTFTNMGEKKKKNPLVIEISLKWYLVCCPLSSSLLCFTLTLHVSFKVPETGIQTQKKR